jgi:hypothetical protein
MELMVANGRDYSAPPRTEYEGREFKAEITFCLIEDATEDEIWEWLEYELGGGSIASAHPLVKNGASLNRVSVDDLRPTGSYRYTDWGATSKDGRCSGKGRVERSRTDAVSA